MLIRRLNLWKGVQWPAPQTLVACAVPVLIVVHKLLTNWHQSIWFTAFATLKNLFKQDFSSTWPIRLKMSGYQTQTTQAARSVALLHSVECCCLGSLKPLKKPFSGNVTVNDLLSGFRRSHLPWGQWRWICVHLWTLISMLSRMLWILVELSWRLYVWQTLSTCLANSMWLQNLESRCLFFGVDAPQWSWRRVRSMQCTVRWSFSLA